MEIISFSAAQFEDFRRLADRELRHPDAETRIWEDFPLILDQDNRGWALGILQDGGVAAGLSCLIRQYKTSCGTVPVAGIGSVVTRAEYRGRGFSGELQEAMRAKLAAANVPLAVLWSDQPDIYRGRGFVPAGWEFHVDMEDLGPGPGFPDGFSCRPFKPEDVAAVEALNDRHPYRTLRHPGDAARLYTMPGTRGLVAVGEHAEVVGAVFCGKGSDFSDYVTEWDGPVGLAVPLLDEVRARDWARHLLVPAGGERLAEILAGRGGLITARTSGLWVVLQPDQLSRYLQGAGRGSPLDPSDPAAVLGTVDRDGVIEPGVLTLAVWGFDSV